MSGSNTLKCTLSGQKWAVQIKRGGNLKKQSCLPFSGVSNYLASFGDWPSKLTMIPLNSDSTNPYIFGVIMRCL